MAWNVKIIESDSRETDLIFGVVSEIEDPFRLIVKFTSKDVSGECIAYPRPNFDLNKPEVGDSIIIFRMKIENQYIYEWIDRKMEF